MKIGIMSMQRIENYGSFLQAYALRRILEQMGHQVVFVDYRIEPCMVKAPVPEQPPRRPLWYRAIRKGYYLIQDGIQTLNGTRAAEKKLEESRLRNRYAQYLEELGITKQRTENVPVDVLIIGSDEVFNCLQTNPAVGYSRQLFGEGVNADKVISYAACAGFTTVEKLRQYGICEEVAQMLRTNFASMSVRDSNTFDLVKALTGKEPEIHLDPVLVGQLAELCREKKDLTGYVVVYSYEERMSNRERERDAIQNFAHERGLKTVSIGNYQTWTDLHLEADPFELLGYYKNAEYIVTDTFHGTVFSIVMEKRFAVIVRDSNAEKLGSLLQQFGFEDRQVRELSQLEATLTAPIRFDQARKKLAEERKRTIEYLTRAIGPAPEEKC